MPKVLFAWITLLGAIPATVLAQPTILGRNLIANGDAESGPSTSSLKNVVASIPNWTSSGGITVLQYDATGYVLLSYPAPPNHGFQYFAGASYPSPATLTQDIDVSSGAAVIAGGNVKFTASGYLGGGGQASAPKMEVAFKNAAGQTFSSITLGPVAFGVGMYLQEQIGLVPPGTTKITVTLSALGVNAGWSAFDNLSLVLDTLATSPDSVLGSNLIANPGAEAGVAAKTNATALNIPGWSTTGGASVAAYGGAGWIQASDPGPADRGVNVFKGGPSEATIYQDLDVSGAGSMIDASKVSYQVSAWLGGYGGAQSPTLTYQFFDWSGKQLAATALLGPAAHAFSALVPVAHSDTLPVGTRHVHLEIKFPVSTSLADNISFQLGAAGAPTIAPGGVVPIDSPVNTVMPGSWISIYGTNLANATASWNGDFPISLGGVSVTIDSKPAYLWFVSPTQINLQVPDDSATGPVSVVVQTPAGTATSTVTLAPVAPAFLLFNAKYPAAIVPTSGAGNSGSGYDYIGPAGGLPFPSRPVKAGEILLLFGVGFGPTTPAVPAGQLFSGAASCVTLPTVTIGGVQAIVSFAGLVGAGLYQFDVVVPNAGGGDKPLLASAGGVSTPTGVSITLQ